MYLQLLSLLGLHYSYMELEQAKRILVSFFLQAYYIIPIWNWSVIHWNQCREHQYHYIIPIWNWSFKYFSFITQKSINYIIPIWNWSSLYLLVISLEILITLFLYGIGAFGWGFMFQIIFYNYIIPIWNWSFFQCSFCIINI